MASSFFSHSVEATTGPRCSNCGSHHVFRTARTGFLRERVFPRFGYFPWECRICRAAFLLRMRHTTGKRERV